MNASEPYARVRSRMVELANGLTQHEADAFVAATPAWTVTDVYRHLAGSCADLLDGRLDGITTDPWTQAQVDARAGRPLTEVVDEWTALAPRIDDLVDGLGEAMDQRFFIDAWTHEQDVRGSLGQPGGLDDPIVATAMPGMMKGACIRVRRAGLDPIEIRAGAEANQSGEDASVRLTVSDYEFLRGVLGRRSRRQMLAWDWTWPDGADRDGYVDALMVFGMATHDIDDAT